MLELSETLQFLLSASLIAMVGGICHWLMSDDHSMFQLLVSIFLAGFSGFLIAELCIQYKVSESAAFFLCGSSGLCAELVLKIARKALLAKMALLTEQRITDELDIIEEDFRRNRKEYKERKETSEVFSDFNDIDNNN